MILLFNVKISSIRFFKYERAPWLPVYSRLDIFKYCLASYAVMLPLISKCEFYIDLEPEFESKREELTEFINSLYPLDKLSLNWYNHHHCRDWRKWCEKVNLSDDQLIWNAGNDDHIFIDSSLDVLEQGLTLLKNDPNPLSQLYYSHWPEQMAIASGLGNLTEDGNYVKYPFRTFDAITVMKGERWKHYWFDQDWGDIYFGRTDPLFHIGYELTGPIYAPTKELVRHYDGYSHVGKLANTTPPLFIPPGFFDGNMVIKFGYQHRDDACVNFNPTSEWLYQFSKFGTDYRWLPSDIPLFWKNNINITFDIAPDIDMNIMTDARNAAFLACTKPSLVTYNQEFPAEVTRNKVTKTWFENHLISI